MEVKNINYKDFKEKFKHDGAYYFLSTRSDTNYIHINKQSTYENVSLQMPKSVYKKLIEFLEIVENET